ncbi:alpha/beta fold hydrolase [Thaumasiovibrio sp. DFM-14]|uniref:alpha/beta fold hydrolase n=1 Tax=Thaumasiovibrio sp. DFM-14 TaxID=3384792 RepID=UPI0039A2B9B8
MADIGSEKKIKVVVLHGLYMHGVVMIPLCRRITQAGYEVLNLTYNTIKPDTEKMFEEIDQFAQREPIILVGHSMGGVMSRQYLESRQDNSVQAVITLGTPHQGAKIAKYIHRIGLKDVVLRDSAKYLLPQKVEWTHRARLYSLAGNFSLGVLPIILQSTERPSDGIVLLEETKMKGMWRHKTMRQTHESMLVSTEVADWVLAALDEEEGYMQRGCNEIIEMYQ